MKKVIKKSVAVMAGVLVLTSFSAFGAEGAKRTTPGVITDVTYGETVETNSPFANYTVELGNYSYAAYNDINQITTWGMSGVGDINLYSLESKIEDGADYATAEFVVAPSMKESDVYIRKYTDFKSASRTNVASFKISDLYTKRQTVAVEDKWLKLSVGDTAEGNVCLSLLLTNKQYDENQTVVSATYDKSTRLLTVLGENPDWKQNYLNVVMIKKSDSSIGYINQVFAEDGSFSEIFKFTNNPEDYSVVVNDGENTYVILGGDIAKTESNTAPVAVLSIEFLKEKNSVKASVSANKAFYGINDSSFLIIAYYDENKALIGLSSAKNWDKTYETAVLEDAKFAKAFVFNSTEKLVPQSPAAELELSEN